MDPITQGLLGAATAQLGFRQRIGREATWVAAAAALVPDLDIFTGPLLRLGGAQIGWTESVRYHRALSHSLLMAPLLSLPIAMAWWYARRARRRRRPDVKRDLASRPPPSFRLLWACVFVAIFTHPLLDWSTSYGTQLLAPLTDTRYAADAAPIIDMIYTAALALTLLACLLVRKIRRTPSPRATLAVGWAGVLLTTGYLGAGRILHDRAIEKASALVKNERIVRADAYPALGTIFLWRTVIETQDAWQVTRVHHFSSSPPESWKTSRAAKATGNAWIEKARALPEFKTYRWFARGRLRTEYEQVDGLHVVRVHDMRYARRTDGLESLWPLVIQFDATGRVAFVGRRMERHVGRHAAAFWRDIWNP